MAGYNWNAGMSNNAVDAYDNGLLPASKIKGIPAALIEAHCRYAEWHHASKAFNKVKFYDEAYVLATFGLIEHEEYKTDQQAIEALAKAKAEKKAAKVETFTNCIVEWIEWVGSLKRPKAYPQREEGCTVSVKGQTCTITLTNGTAFTKRITTKGFSFKEVKNV